MALPATYAKVTIQTQTPQKAAVYNVFYYVPQAAPMLDPDRFTNALDVAAAVRDIICPPMLDVLSVDTTVVGVIGEIHLEGFPYVVEALYNQTGNVASDQTADWVACIIQKRTAVDGKSGRGRWFLGPIAESLTDENRITAAAVPLLQAVVDAWKASVTAVGEIWDPQLYSAFTDVLTPITGAYANHRLGSIGGRKSHTLL